MAEEQELQTTTFAEINAQHSVSGDMLIDSAADNNKPSAEPNAPAESVNWENKYKEFETNYAKEKETFTVKEKDYQAKLAEFEKKTPPITHKDSDLSRLEVLKATAPEKFPLFTKLLWGNPDSADLWKMDFIEKNPEYKDDPDTVQMMLEAEFEHYFDGTDKDEREFKIAENRLKIAGNQIKAAKLSEFKAIQIDDPQEKQKSIEDSRKELAKSWEIPFSEMTKNPLKISQKIVLDDKSEIPIDYDLSPEDNKKYTDLMGVYILHNDLKPSAENAQKARDFVMGEILREKGWDISKASFQKEINRRYEEWQKSRNNNRPLTPPGISNDGKKSVDQQVNETIEHGEVYVPNK